MLFVNLDRFRSALLIAYLLIMYTISVTIIIRICNILMMYLISYDHPNDTNIVHKFTNLKVSIFIPRSLGTNRNFEALVT